MKDIHGLATASSVRLTVDSEESYMHEHEAAVAQAVPKSIAAPMKRVLVLGAGFVSHAWHTMMMMIMVATMAHAQQRACTVDNITTTTTIMMMVMMSVCSCRCPRRWSSICCAAPPTTSPSRRC